MSWAPEPLPPDLAEAFERERARIGRLGSSVTYFATTGSTSDVALSLAEQGAGEGAIVIADAQTAGRGRRGRTWFSPPASGLYVSVIVEPPPAARALITLMAGVALVEGVYTATGLAANIKWPNDLMVGSKKVAGILAESVSTGGVVLGYGVNMSEAAYPPEISSRATSIERELKSPVDRPGLLIETLASLAQRYDDLLSERYDVILDAWREHSPGSKGRRVSWETTAGIRSGVTAGIDDQGALLVTVGNEVERLVAGEVVWV